MHYLNFLFSLPHCLIIAIYPTSSFRGKGAPHALNICWLPLPWLNRS